MNARRAVTSLVALAALTVACNESLTEISVAESELPLAEAPVAGEPLARLVSLISYYGDPVVIEAPARTQVGTPTDVYVTTYEGGCNRADTTVSQVAGRRATVVPYRLVRTDPNVACAAILIVNRRLVRLTFESSGTSTIRVVGREEPGSRLFAVERRILVD